MTLQQSLAPPVEENENKDPVVVPEEAQQQKAEALDTFRRATGVKTRTDAIKEIETEDIASQREGRSADDVMDEIVANNKPVRIGDRVISPNLITSARPERGNITDKNVYLNLRKHITKVEGPKTGVVIAGVRDDEIVTPQKIEEQYHGYEPKWRRQTQTKMTVDQMLMQAGVPDDVRQIVAEEFTYGNVVEETYRRFREAVRGVGVALPNLIKDNAWEAVGAMNKAGTVNIFSPAFKAEFDAVRPKIQQGHESYKNKLRAAFGPIGFEIAIADNHNAIIHENLEEKFKESDPERYENLAFEKGEDGQFILDDNGEKIKRKFIDSSQAEFILDAGFETLSYPERAAAIIGEETLMMLATGGGYNAARGAAMIRKAQRLKKNKDYAPALQGIDDPEDIVNAMSHVLGYDSTNKYFQAGLLQYRTDESAALLTRQIIQADRKVIALRAVKNPTKLQKSELKRAEAELRQYKQTRTTAFTRGRYIPYVKDSVESAAIIGGGAFLFREHGFFFEDENTREFIGLLAMSLGGYRVAGIGGRLVGAAGRGAKSVAEAQVPTIFEMGAEVISKIPLVGPIVVDTTVRNIQQSLGRELKPSEIRNLQVIVGTFSKLDPRMRREAFESMQETTTLYNRIVNAFEPGADRELARSLFLQSYANSTGLLTIAAADSLHKSEVNISGIMGVNVSDFENNLRESTNLIRATDMALDKFLQSTQNIKDKNSAKFVEEWVAARKAGLGRLQDRLSEKNAAEFQALDALENYVLKTGQVKPGDGDMRDQLVSLRKAYLESLGQTVDDAELIEALDEKVRRSIDEAIEQAQAARGTGVHAASANKALEMLLDETKYLAYRDGKKPYEVLDGKAKELNIDLQPVFEDLMKQNDFDGIRRYFGPESEMFKGAGGQGNIALNAFEDMMYRVIPRDTLANMRTQMDEEFIASSGKRGMNTKGMSDHEVFLEVLKADRIRAAEEGTEVQFKPFSEATAYETEMMHRAFDRAADTYENSQAPNAKELESVFRGFANRMDTYLESQNPEYFAELENARQSWRRTVGEATEEGMILGDYSSPSRQKRILSTVERGTMAGVFGTRALYVQGKEPIEHIRDLSGGISDWMSPGSKKNALLLQSTMQKLAISLGRVMPDGSRGFDLTDPQEARRFEQLRNILQEVILEQTGDRVLKASKSKRAISGKRLTSLTGFDVESVGDMDTITRYLVVPVRRSADGPVEYESIFDVAEMYGSMNTLQKAVDDSEEVREAMIKLKQDFSTAKKDAQSDINLRIEQDERSLRLWEQEINQLNGVDFFKNFILTREGGSLETLKAKAISTYKEAGYSDADAEEAFNAVATKYVIQGMFDTAGVGPVAGKVPGADPKRSTPLLTVENPEQLLELMTSDNVREQLEKIIEPEHLEFITDIVKYTNESTMTVKVKPTGAFLGMSLSSKISRGWNLIRGVVSPAYVAADYAFQAAKAGQIDMFKLALQDKEAAQMMVAFFQPMEIMNPVRLERFNNAVKTFMFTELARQGEGLSEVYIDEDPEKNKQLNIMQTDNVIYDNPTVFGEGDEQEN